MIQLNTNQNATQMLCDKTSLKLGVNLFTHCHNHLEAKGFSFSAHTCSETKTVGVIEWCCNGHQRYECLKGIDLVLCTNF